MKTNPGMQRFILPLAAVIGVTAASGCLSEQEKVARRACALDVSGDYTEVRADGTTAGTLKVENESDKNDVKLTFTRGALYDGEQGFIDRLANDEDKTAVKTSLVFGAGDDKVTDGLVGGQNVSDDFGASSKIAVGAPDMEAVPNADGATDPKVHYALAVDIENGSDQLTGKLTVTFTENEKDATSNDSQLHSESKSFDVTFARSAGVLQQDQSDECKAAVDGK